MQPFDLKPDVYDLLFNIFSTDRKDVHFPLLKNENLNVYVKRVENALIEFKNDIRNKLPPYQITERSDINDEITYTHGVENNNQMVIEIMKNSMNKLVLQILWLYYAINIMRGKNELETNENREVGGIWLALNTLYKEFHYFVFPRVTFKFNSEEIRSHAKIFEKLLNKI
jgi:hypothetical protein